MEFETFALRLAVAGEARPSATMRARPIPGKLGARKERMAGLFRVVLKIAAKQHGSTVFYQPRRVFALPRTFGFVHTLVVVSNLEGNCPMSMQSHLAELERRHKALEREIESEKTHPGADDLRIVELKRKKLLLKDQIEKLRVNRNEPERVLH